MCSLKFIALFPFLTFYISISYGQLNKRVIADYAEKLETFSTDTNYKRINVSKEGYESLTGYYEGDSIKQMTDHIMHSFGFEKNSFLFKNNKLLFVRKIQYVYEYIDSIKMYNKSNSKKSFEGFYLFSDKEIVQKKTKGKEVIEVQLSIDPLPFKLNSSLYFLFLSKRGKNMLQKRK